ncbi:aminotransferase class V-fold PLP-dependent enzyme [Erwiniaceae bacterium BAC15a-03b]|uniref:Aminotransferase class V-fold PLP-dependent enzyme n=1 Tax=Winslowiella arboricola TaxID=2978220 RepID=A0A9J6PP07_9GAMM|nr:aminotransferase class V-fold PLP-dependent enzyme [Winslowiella arboricola]MCU5773905.1 aminotransferase class V-fold PLP-dependent enzyme [Winslowiella arboricola]MCU5777368.1 aminotransferase class V-fold PLP-dependent enzyme [Winslowiella arboricola]
MNIQGHPQQSNLNSALNSKQHCAQPATTVSAFSTQQDLAKTLSIQLRKAVLEIAGCNNQWSAIPLQGSGIFAVEAMLCSLLSPTDHLLIVENGVSASRMAEICYIHHIRYSILKLDTLRGIELAQVAAVLDQDSSITHLAAAHFEASLGVKNDIDGLARLAVQYGCRLLVDVISTFGVLPLNFASPALAAVALSASQCLHGVPGMAFVLVCKNELTQKTPPRTFSLDLKAQYRALKSDGQWRFTPPLQVMLALKQAIDDYRLQGGREARFQLYCQRMIHLLKGMAALGFQPLIEPQYCAPLFVTLVGCRGQHFATSKLSECLLPRQLALSIISNGVDTFRIGVQGEVSLNDIDDLLTAVRDCTSQQQLNHLSQMPSG